MQKEMPIIFKIKDADAQEKIIKIRQNCVNFTELFKTWVLEYNIRETKQWKDKKELTI